MSVLSSINRRLPFAPNAPAYAVTELSSNAAAGGFLTVKSYGMALGARQGVYDVVTRTSMDAVVIAAFFLQDQNRHVILRSTPRIPVLLAHPTRSVLWELPAGLIDEGEHPEEAASRELHEEIGVTPLRLGELGPWAFPLPGLIAERHFFYWAEVPPPPWECAQGDGSIFEASASLHSMTLDDALEAARQGLLRDEKTELTLRRLAELPR
jgi:ADP-ribose pyrophosphatase